MPQTQSFAELLAAAPAADEEGEGALSATGILARSADPTKFVLTLGTGQSVTLDVDAVTNHQMLSRSIGRTIVRVDLDPSKVPPELASGPLAMPQQATAAAFATTVAYTNWHTVFGVDHIYTLPYDPQSSDTIGGSDATGFEDSDLAPYANSAVVPFGLAVPHRAAAAAAMAAQIHGRINGAKIQEDRKHLYDHGKDPLSDTVPPYRDI